MVGVRVRVSVCLTGVLHVFERKWIASSHLLHLMWQCMSDWRHTVGTCVLSSSRASSTGSPEQRQGRRT